MRNFKNRKPNKVLLKRLINKNHKPKEINNSKTDPFEYLISLLPELTTSITAYLKEQNKNNLENDKELKVSLMSIFHYELIYKLILVIFLLGFITYLSSNKIIDDPTSIITLVVTLFFSTTILNNGINIISGNKNKDKDKD
jgi:ABC-type siderophore export system fused ATPase/permease subunit